ncbi:hypothetical protein [Burkholderia phage BCSR5]|nr:hypothetical protein [Burkholderia phage BCSR5]
MVQRNPLFYDDGMQAHRPLDGGDTIPPSTVPLSPRPGNQIQRLPDGLYYGNTPPKPTIYVDGQAGTDNPASGGSAGSPYKTIDYALQHNFTNNTLANAKIILLLKAGQRFDMAGRYNIVDGARFEIGWYGDPKYADYPSTVGPNSVEASIMSDLTRPVIVTHYGVQGQEVVLSGFNIAESCHFRLAGFQVDIAGVSGTAPGIASYGGYSDFVTFTNGMSGARLVTVGMIANKQDTVTAFGFIGVHARAGLPNWAQFATQMLVAGLPVSAGNNSPDRLLARGWFIKMYTDIPAASTKMSVIPDSVNSSPGSGILMLSYTDTAVQTIVSTTQNIGTFPLLADPTFGFRNYILGLTEDSQRRPMNILSSRRF